MEGGKRVVFFFFRSCSLFLGEVHFISEWLQIETAPAWLWLRVSAHRGGMETAEGSLQG